jgi:hypothetical protein
MPWLSEFEDLLRAAGQAAGVGPGIPAVDIDDPLAGRFRGPRALAEYVINGRTWMREHRAMVTKLATTTSAQRTVGEYAVEVSGGGRQAVIPVAAVAEATPGLTRLRVYLSLWAFSGMRLPRPPLLDVDPACKASDVVGRYLEALGAGDVDGCVACYEPDGCLQGGGGPAFARCGTSTLKAVYAEHLARGGIALRPCTVTEDGVRTGVEFALVRWGDVDLAPQAGLAVYERGPTGLMARARVYDDASRPF